MYLSGRAGFLSLLGFVTYLINHVAFNPDLSFLSKKCKGKQRKDKPQKNQTNQTNIKMNTKKTLTNPPHNQKKTLRQKLVRYHLHNFFLVVFFFLFHAPSAFFFVHEQTIFLKSLIIQLV